MNTEELKDYIIGLGADFCGIADLTVAAGYIKDHYPAKFGEYNQAITFGVRMPKALVEELMDHPTQTYLAYYDIANSLLNQISLKVNNLLEKQGYKTYPVPASQRTGNRDDGVFSHRLAANLGGLGWIGKSCNLINPEVGPALRLGTVLVKGDFKTDKPLENKCGSCTKCVDACPAGAIKGRLFNDGESITRRFDFKRCDDYLTETRMTFGKRICGRCVAACRVMGKVKS